MYAHLRPRMHEFLTLTGFTGPGTVEDRLAKHNAGTGASFSKGRVWRILLYIPGIRTKVQATTLETFMHNPALLLHKSLKVRGSASNSALTKRIFTFAMCWACSGNWPYPVFDTHISTTCLEARQKVFSAVRGQSPGAVHAPPASKNQTVCISDTSDDSDSDIQVVNTGCG